jgi:hypothetical protein
MELRLIRHGPKNNDPQAHQTGVEALLDSQRIHEIITYASDTLNSLDPEVIKKIKVETTLVNRSIVTGGIIHQVLNLDPRFVATPPTIQHLLSPHGKNPITNEIINLSPKAMSYKWAEAKKLDDYNLLQGEHKPLYSWCEQGFDNQLAMNSNDPGFSLREIACRIGAYTAEKILNLGDKDLTIAIGHSGYLEPFLYLILDMLNGGDGTDPITMLKYFQETGGALEPLTGLIIEKTNSGLYLSHFSGKPGTNLQMVKKPISIEIFQQQAKWLKEYGQSDLVLQKKIEY